MRDNIGILSLHQRIWRFVDAKFRNMIMENSSAIFLSASIQVLFWHRVGNNCQLQWRPYSPTAIHRSSNSLRMQNATAHFFYQTYHCNMKHIRGVKIVFIYLNILFLTPLYFQILHINGYSSWIITSISVIPHCHIMVYNIYYKYIYSYTYIYIIISHGLKSHTSQHTEN